ncbi:MAG: hypothetical protein ACT6RN_04355 [Agrobacterium sp.]|uniref:hypothetical protein n=1 Tax=Agrobacterium sp. TaxID=361 RepID=UPI0040384448
MKILHAHVSGIGWECGQVQPVTARAQDRPCHAAFYTAPNPGKFGNGAGLICA